MNYSNNNNDSWNGGGGGGGGLRSEAERQWWLRRMYARHIHQRAAYYYGKSSWESCLFITIISFAVFIFFVGLIVVGATGHHNHGHGHGEDWWTKDTSGLLTLAEQMKKSTNDMFVYRPYACEQRGKPFARHDISTTTETSSPKSGLTGPSGGTTVKSHRKLAKPREISNLVCNRKVFQNEAEHAYADRKSLDFFRPNKAHLSNFVWVWGQFIQQCIVSTEAGGRKLTLNFTGDSHFDPQGAGYVVDLEGVKCMGEDSEGREILLNTISPLLDAACVYGNSKEVSMNLRSQKAGQMRMSRSMSDEAILSMDDRHRLFQAGDSRVNENAPLTAMYTLWTREHNALAVVLAELHPEWKDEQIYWMARRMVTAEIQSITYHEWLPALFGGEDRVPALETTRPLASETETILSLAFSVVAFRGAHSMVPDTLPLISPGIGGVVDVLPLHTMFMNPELIRKGGIDAILAGLAASPMEEVDLVYSDSLRDALFVGGPSRDLKLDLASLDISRGREAKIGTYGELRKALGLRSPSRWDEITKDLKVLGQLKKVYPDGPASMDPIIGMLAEDHLKVVDDAGTCTLPLPPTMAAVWKQEFSDVRNGDPFYYEVDPGMENLRDVISQTRLHHIILRNTNIAETVLLGKAAATHVLPIEELLKQKHKAKKHKKKHRSRYKKKHRRHHHHHKHSKDEEEVYEKHINEGAKTETSLFFTNGRLDDLYYTPMPMAPVQSHHGRKKKH